jgi:hypothetical protein
MAWWSLFDELAEGGVLEFDSGWELHVCKQGGRYAVWISDETAYYGRVEMGCA